MEHDEAVRIFSLHPAVEVLSPQPEDLAELGLILLRFDDGETIGLNPELIPPAGPGETEEAFIERVHLELDARRGSSEDDERGPESALPAPRSADYFLPRAGARLGRVGRLTDFIGVALAIDEPNALRMVMERDLPADRSELDDFQLLSRAVVNLHDMEDDGLALREVGLGPDVVAVTSPYGHEVAWFADLGTMGQVLQACGAQSGSEWVAIPAARNDLLLVNSATEQWEPVLEMLETKVEARDGIHPVPHVVREGRWARYIPPLPEPLGRRFQTLRLRSENVIHAPQRSFLQESLLEGGESEVDYVAEFNGAASETEIFSWAAVSLALERTSIPRVDRVFFAEGESGHRVSFDDLRARLPHLVMPHPGTYPPRYIVLRPSEEDLTRLF
mgnify:CR=1 FL=1